MGCTLRKLDTQKFSSISFQKSFDFCFFLVYSFFLGGNFPGESFAGGNYPKGELWWQFPGKSYPGERCPGTASKHYLEAF